MPTLKVVCYLVWVLYDMIDVFILFEQCDSGVHPVKTRNWPHQRTVELTHVFALLL